MIVEQVLRSLAEETMIYHITTLSCFKTTHKSVCSLFVLRQRRDREQVSCPPYGI